MAVKLLIVLVNTDPRKVEEVASALSQAAVAAAMDFAVEVICTAAGARLMKRGFAQELTLKPGAPRTVYDLIKDAHEAGAKFLACSGNLDLFAMTEADLIPECSGFVGSAYLIGEAMSDDCRVLTY